MYEQDKSPIQLYLIILFAFSAVISMLSIGYDLDNKIARAIYDPDSEWAWFVRNYSNIPGTIISLGVIALLLITPLRLKSNLLRRNAIVWLSALAIGGGIIVHLIAKESVDRLRPRDSVLIEQTIDAAEKPSEAQSAKIKGKSFPSGHVAMAIMFAVPFFPLRRRKPKCAYAFLTFGLVYGGVVALSRMTLGAHFLTDVVWSITLVLGTAAVTAHYVDEHTDFKTRHFAPLLFIVGIIGILMNKFTLELSHELLSNDPMFHLPCKTYKLSPGEGHISIKLDLKGYGAPLSTLRIKEKDDGTVQIDQFKGLYRNFKCTAHISVPKGQEIWLPTGPQVINPELLPINIQGLHAIYYGK